MPPPPDLTELKTHALALHDLMREHKDRKVQHHLRKLVFQLEMTEERHASVPEVARILAGWLARLCDAEHGALVRRYPGEEDECDAARIDAHVQSQREQQLAGAALHAEVERGVKHLAGMLGVSGAQTVPVAERISWFAGQLLEHLRQDREMGEQLHQLARATMESLRSVQSILLSMDDDSPELQHIAVMLEQPVPDDPVAARAHLQRISHDLQQVQRRMVERGKRAHRAIDERVQAFANVSEQLESARNRTRSDSLTGLPNRRALKAFLAEQHPNQTITLAMIDIDQLRDINAAVGDKGGDRCLCAIAETLDGRLRTDDMLFRIGGDEFVVVFPGIDGKGGIRAAHGLRESICNAPITIANRTVTLRLSLGVAERNGNEKLLSWLKRADAALYVAKGKGGNRVELAP